MITIHDIDRYRIKSQSNGAFFLVERKADGASVFFQGDDAVEFDADLEHCHTESDLEQLCGHYDDVMGPD